MAKRRHSVRRHKRVKTKNSSKRGRRLEERVAVPNNCLLIHTNSWESPIGAHNNS